MGGLYHQSALSLYLPCLDRVGGFTETATFPSQSDLLKVHKHLTADRLVAILCISPHICFGVSQRCVIQTERVFPPAYGLVFEILITSLLSFYPPRHSSSGNTGLHATHSSVVPRDAVCARQNFPACIVMWLFGTS